jgi:hypothetical protein
MTNHSWLRNSVFLFLLTTNLDAWGQRAKQKREAGYQAALQSYSETLKLGTTRKDVEDYFQTNDIKYQKMCCVVERSAYAELVKIGEEKHP